MRAGLAVAMDRSVVAGDPGHSPWDGHAKKICCTFGTPMDWEAMQLGRFQLTSPNSWYVANMPVMLGIINDAAALDPVCKSDDSYYCASSKAGGGFTGRWECPVWGEDTIIEIKQKGNKATIKDISAGEVYQGQVSGDTLHFVVPDSTGATSETRYKVTLKSGGSIIDLHGQMYTSGREDNTIIGPFGFSCSKVTN